MKPLNAVILAVGRDWVSAARLPRVLVQAGFRVFACCSEDSILLKTRFLHGSARLNQLDGNGLWQALKQIRGTWGIDLLLPGDDASACLLHNYAAGDSTGWSADDLALKAVLSASLGRSAGHPAVVRRAELAALPPIPGVAFPRQAACRQGDDLAAAMRAVGFPLVVKRNFSAGGYGVHILRDEAEAAAFAGRDDLFQDHEAGYRTPHTHDLLIQALITGPEASVSFSARDGRLLAAFAYRKREGYPTLAGPTSLAERLNRPDLIEAAAALVRHFGFTGFGGVDFMIEEPRGRPFVIELNPRPTISTHLGGVFGLDLGVALHEALAGRPVPDRRTPLGDLVALFPGEWARDPDSPHLATGAYHDVPWDDPPLLDALMTLKRERMPRPEPQRRG